MLKASQRSPNRSQEEQGFIFFFREKVNIYMALEVPAFKETFRPVPNGASPQSVAVLC